MSYSLNSINYNPKFLHGDLYLYPENRKSNFNFLLRISAQYVSMYICSVDLQ